MPNTKELVRVLVSAFNIHNYARDTVETNFTLQRRDKEDCIVVSFDEGMSGDQCSRYLNDVKRKIIGEFYDVGEDRYEVVLNTGKSIFDAKSFPFNISKGGWYLDEDNNGLEFVTPIDQGMILNFKSHLATSLAKDVLEDMPTCNFSIKVPDKKDYLCHCEFPSKELRKQFEGMFLSRMKERYENIPKKLLETKGSDVYIRDIFNDVRLIDSVTQYAAWLTGMGFHADSKVRSDVKAFKDLIMQFIGQSTGIMLVGFVCASPLDRKEASILIPIILDDGKRRVLASEEALKLNYAFNGAVFNDFYGRTQGELSVSGSSGIYGINFSNPHISHCVMNKIIESSVINENHELSINPELRFRALSPFDGKDGGSPDSSVDEPNTWQYSPRPSLEAGKLFPLQYNVDSSKSLSAAEVDESSKKKSVLERLNLFGRKKSSEPKSPSTFPKHDPGRPPLPPQRTTAAYGQTQLQEFEPLKPGDRCSIVSKDSSEGYVSASSSSSLNLPGSRGSYGSIGSKSSGCGSALSSYLQEGAVDNTAGSSGEGEFSRGSLHNTSFMSNSLTSSSISSNTSNETVVEGNTRDRTSCIDVSHYNREDGSSVLYNEPEGFAKRLGLKPAFEPSKHGQSSSRNWKRFGRDKAIARVSKLPEQSSASSSHAEREKERRKQIPVYLGFSSFYSNDRLYY